METAVSLSQIGLYNPQRQSAELTEKLFVVHQKQFESLMESLNEESPDSIPQHHLILAQRGMGKTTILKRIEVELHKEQYRVKFIPVLFTEEQYGLNNLAKFWLNCLNALANSLEVEDKYNPKITEIDNYLRQVTKEKNIDKFAEKLYQYLLTFCNKLQRRPVLLVDNIGLVFKRLNEKEKYILRGYISENSCPIIISAGVAMAGNSDAKEHVINYKAPFYDFFQIHYLRKLSFDEFEELLQNLSKVTQTNISITSAEKPRLKSLLQLTGGNPRTTVILFKLLVKGFSADIVDDLDALADEMTPLYKARFEELSSQQQQILYAIALNWDKISLEKIREDTGLANNQLSPQLKRLVEDGWLEITKAYKAKGNAYSISERFFSIWHIMRNGTPSAKREINYLFKFLESIEYYNKSIDFPENVKLLEQTLFELHKRNESIACEYLLKALLLVENGLTKDIQSGWEYFAAITVKLGYGQWLLNILEEKEFNIILSPYYVAIQTLEIEKTKNAETAEIYLKNQALEKSDPARTIIEKMKRYV
jgi:DNA-binding MarR family transcriptional regulator